MAGPGTITWSEACRAVARRRLAMPPVFTDTARLPLRLLRVVDIPPEVLSLLRYGHGVDTERVHRHRVRVSLHDAGDGRGVRPGPTVGAGGRHATEVRTRARRRRLPPQLPRRAAPRDLIPPAYRLRLVAPAPSCRRARVWRTGVVLGRSGQGDASALGIVASRRNSPPAVHRRRLAWPDEGITARWSGSPGRPRMLRVVDDGVDQPLESRPDRSTGHRSRSPRTTPCPLATTTAGPRRRSEPSNGDGDPIAVTFSIGPSNSSIPRPPHQGWTTHTSTNREERRVREASRVARRQDRLRSGVKVTPARPEPEVAPPRFHTSQQSRMATRRRRAPRPFCTAHCTNAVVAAGLSPLNGLPVTSRSCQYAMSRRSGAPRKS